MDFEGTEIINASRERVWAFVTDAESMASCTPGMKSFRILEPGKRFEATGGVKLGTVGLNAKTVIEWTHLVELEEANMKIRGRGPGTTIDGIAELRLRDDDAGTAMDWKGTVQVRGTLAALASRLLKPVTEKVLREMFAEMKSKIEAQGSGSAPERGRAGDKTK